MLTPEGYRKRVRHEDRPFEVHELTLSCFHRKPLLQVTQTYAMLAESRGRAVERHQFDLLAFVFMPEHVHLMVKCRVADYCTSDLLYAIRKPFSFRVRERLEEVRDPLLDELIIRERPGKMAFRFWQEGPGYDHNLTTEDALVNALRYIHRNPVRRGLCTTPEQWPWSSFHQYLHPDAPPPNGHPQVRRLKV